MTKAKNEAKKKSKHDLRESIKNVSEKLFFVSKSILKDVEHQKGKDIKKEKKRNLYFFDKKVK
jgi:hypothetical protein